MKKLITAAASLTCALAFCFVGAASAAVIEDGSKYDDYATANVVQINNIDEAFHKKSGFTNGSSAVTVPQSSPIAIDARGNHIRGWALCEEGIEAYGYQLDRLLANGTYSNGDIVYFEPETREDVLAAHPEYASVNPDADVGIDVYIPTAPLSVATYRVTLYALTKAEHKYKVLTCYVTLGIDLDVNGDGVLDIRDAIFYRQMILEQEYNFEKKYDYNNNGKYDEYDYQQLLSYIAGRNE